MNTALRLAAAALLAGTIAACGSDDTGDGADADVIEITYDGTECTSGAPASIPAGEQTFVLINNSDHRVGLWVRRIEDGHTHQELVDLQNEIGGPGTYFERPDWVVPLPMTARLIDLSDTERQYEYDLQAGLVEMVVGPSDQVWFCGGFEAVDA